MVPMMDDGMLQEIAARLPKSMSRLRLPNGRELMSKDEIALAEIEGLTAAHRKVSYMSHILFQELTGQKFGTLILGITVKSLDRGNAVQKRRETVSALQDLRYVPSRSNSAASNRPSALAAPNRPITQHASGIKEPRTNLEKLSSIAQGTSGGRLAQRSGLATGGSGIKLAKPQTVKSKF